MADLKSINRKKLRHTFSRIIPHLLIGDDIVSFFCDTVPELNLYSLDDGDLVCERIRAVDIVSVLMHLKANNIPWNLVDEKTLAKIQRSFKHIYKEEHNVSGLDKKAIEKMRTELNNIFKKNYS